MRVCSDSVFIASLNDFMAVLVCCSSSPELSESLQQPGVHKERRFVSADVSLEGPGEKKSGRGGDDAILNLDILKLVKR